MSNPTFFVKLFFEKHDKDNSQDETFTISTKYANAVKLELVRYELKSEGIDP